MTLSDKLIIAGYACIAVGAWMVGSAIRMVATVYDETVGRINSELHR